MATRFGLSMSVLTVLFFNGSVMGEVSQSELLDKLLNPQFYNKLERPGERNKKPTVITIGVLVNMVSTISEKDMSWKDDRLHYSELNETLNLGYTRVEQIWRPDTYFPNLKGGYKHDLTTPNILLRLSPDGSLFFSQRLALVFACFMELHNFPLDQQKCRLDFMSYGHTVQEIAIDWGKDSNFSLNSRIKLPDFLLSGYNLGNCTETFATGTFACVFSELTFVRQFGYYLTGTFLPTLLIIVLSWVGFWIDYNSTPSRISLGLLTVLAITTQTTGTNAGLPRVSYVKSIDVWMAICLVFVSGALLEFAVVNVIARKQAEGLSLQKEIKRLATIKRVSTASTRELVVKSHWDVEEPRAEIFHEDFNGLGSDSDNTAGGTIANSTTQRNYALLIDKASRVIFPTLFILTTIVYAFSLNLYYDKD